MKTTAGEHSTFNIQHSIPNEEVFSTPRFARFDNTEPSRFAAPNQKPKDFGKPKIEFKYHLWLSQIFGWFIGRAASGLTFDGPALSVGSSMLNVECFLSPTSSLSPA